jgi:hypothetical protein
MHPHAGLDRSQHLPWWVIVAGIAAVILIAGVLIINIPDRSFSSATNKGITPTPTQSVPISSASPLIFGTNLDLSANRDQALATLSPALVNVPVRSVRLTPSSSLKDATLKNIALTLKNMDVVPIIVLQDLLTPNAMATNMRIVKTMQSAFADETVRYEYGDEEDALAVSAETYTAGWNKTIPELKKLASGAIFLGPVTYRFDSTYLKTFLQNAKPQPDEISWHEYSCNNNWDNETCFDHINDWTQHIQIARELMQATMGKEVHIIISAWNYAANSQVNDDKSKDATFIKNWNTRALQILAKNGVFAAMHCSCLGTATDLTSDDGSLTTPGAVFHATYLTLTRQRATSDTISAPTSSPNLTATSVASDPYLTHQGTLLVNDPLSKPFLWRNNIAKGWGGSCTFKNGAYSISQVVTDNRYFHCDAGTLHTSNFIYEAQITILKGDCGGITFRYNVKDHSGYRFVACANGIARLLTYPDGAHYTRLLDEPVAALHTGYNQSNLLAVVARGNTLDLYINKQKIGSFTDNTLHDGMFSLFAAAFGNSTEVAFRNVNIWRL